MGYLRISFLGRTTQRANSPTKAPAAAMAIIGCPPNLVYDHSIAPGCYTPFCMDVKCLLQVEAWKKQHSDACCRRGSWSIASIPRKSPDAVMERGIRIATGRQDSDLLAKELLGEDHPESEQSDKGSGGGDGYHWVSSELGVP